MSSADDPLSGLSKQIDRLLEGYCFQILATNRDPDAHNGKIIQTATHLTWILAEYLADTIAWLMRSILDHASKILFDHDTEPLLTPGFWILPLYRELLNSARRNRPSAASERARGCTGLVKLICKENKKQRGKGKFHEGGAAPQRQRRIYRVVWVVQLDQRTVCVVSCKLGANGSRAGVWYVVQSRGAF